MAQETRRQRTWGRLRTPAAIFRRIGLPRNPIGRAFEFAFRDRGGHYQIIAGTIVGYEIEIPVLGTRPRDDAPGLVLTVRGTPELDGHPSIVALGHTGFWRGEKGNDASWDLVFDGVVERDTKDFEWSKVYPGHLSIMD